MMSIPNPLPTGEALCRLAEGFLAKGEFEDLFVLADVLWSTTPIAVGTAQVTRLAALAHLAIGERSTPKGDANFAASKAMRIRAYSAAMLDHNPHVVALLAQKDIYELLAKRAFATARLALEAAERLVEESSAMQPSAAFVRRALAQRRAYSYYGEGYYEEAITHYGRALELSDEGGREILNSRGALAVAMYMAQKSTLSATVAVVTEILNDGAQFPFVSERAQEALAALAGGEAACRELVPFDVLL